MLSVVYFPETMYLEHQTSVCNPHDRPFHINISNMKSNFGCERYHRVMDVYYSVEFYCTENLVKTIIKRLFFLHILYFLLRGGFDLKIGIIPRHNR